jgi:hypothetical protein
MGSFSNDASQPNNKQFDLLKRSVFMTQIRVSILDHTGGKKTVVELPDDVPMNQLIPALVGSMNLPTQQGGNPVTYRLNNIETEEQLADDETLAEAGAESGTVFSLFPEVTAGGDNVWRG